MTFDEIIFNYEMNDRDRQLANIAQIIISAYNGSYKPHPIPKEKELAPPYYMWKHSKVGYSLITSQTEDFASPTVLVTDENINDFVEHVFLVLAGTTEVKWDKVYTSDAVKHALDKHFGMKVDLSNTGPNYETEGIFGTPKLPIRPTIWATVDLKANPDAWVTMEEKRFNYFDRNMWIIEL